MRGRRFTRSETVRHIKLGKRSKKLQKWRRPRGTHNKIRKRRVHYPLMPLIGYKRTESVRGFVKGKRPIHISNMKELQRVAPHSLVIFSRSLGARSRITLLKHAHEHSITVLGTQGGKA